MSLTLKDQGGNKLARLGVAGIKRVLMSPVQSTVDAIHKDYAMVWCQEAEIYISRYGWRTRSYTITLTYWDSACKDALPIEEEFDASERDKAITKFLKLCKRNPLYAAA